MTDFQNLELIDKAIDNYALFNKTQKNVLKALIRVNIGGYSTISIKELCKRTGVTNAPISKALSCLEQYGVIEDIGRRGIIFTGCRVKQSKISEIINRYKIKD